MIKKSQLNALLAYAAAVLLSILLVAWVMKLWRADLSVPFANSGDVFYYQTIVKGMMDNGWYLHNDYVGMPTGLDLHDFPQHDNLLYGFIKIISLFSHNYPEALNSYFLLTFPLTTLLSLLVFRHFKFSFIVSLFGSLLFTFLPYHFMRGEPHLTLSSYYLIPPMVMLVLWVFSERPLFWKRAENGGRLMLSLGSESIMALVICLLVSSNVYYAFFGCFFLLIAGLSVSARAKAIRPLMTAGVLTTVIGAGFILSMVPHFAYQNQHGKNTSSVIRGYTGPEVYGLKIAQLLLPVTGHRIPLLQKEKERYNTHAQYVNENDFSTLGIIGSLGFLFLIIWIFVGDFFSRGAPDVYGISDQIRDVSLLNLSAVILAVIGGFAIFVGMLLAPNIRGYNRISVYIAFFSLFAVVAILDEVRRRYAVSGVSRVLFSGCLALLLVVGILDQTTEGFVPSYETIKKDFSDRVAFVRSIEGIVPEKAMLFQLPYVPFPENPPVNRMHDYDHFGSGYLVSKTLRWSYGAMKGRPADDWQKMVSEKPLPEFLEALSAAGFIGITVDTFGYADGGADVSARLTAALGPRSLVSPDNRHLFFSLEAYDHMRM